jgi:heme o synthase
LQTSSVRRFLAFIRFKVTIAVTFSAYTAMIVCRESFSLLDLLPVSGIFLLASGASALNQYQEREYDARMRRTMNRPLPSADFKAGTAFWIASLLLFTGMLLIAFGEYWLTLILGIINVIWYNGLYTWLKKRTAFAVIPGALTGAIPVMMGWTAAGGYPFHPLPLFLAFVIFIWQVPHFWLLALIYEDDYRKAGFPTLLDIFTLPKVKRIIFSWLSAASLSSFLLFFSGVTAHGINMILLLLMNAILLFLSAYYLFISRISRYHLLFMMVNVFMLLVLFMIIADNLSSRLN